MSAGLQRDKTHFEYMEYQVKNAMDFTDSPEPGKTFLHLFIHH